MYIHFTLFHNLYYILCNDELDVFTAHIPHSFNHLETGMI